MTSDIHTLSIPNPYFEGQNSVYLIDTEPITLIDTGIATDVAFADLAEEIRTLGFAITDIARVILTHKHIDHMGNAWRLQQQGGAEVWIHHLEQKSVTDVDPSGARFGSLVQRRLLEWGVPMQEPKSGSNAMPRWQLQPVTQIQPLADGQLLPQGKSELTVWHTPGHSMGSICLQYGEALFTGDHILQRITPNIGGGDMRSSGMLGRFLHSLGRMQRLGDLHVFPGHGVPFRGLPERCQELSDHHEMCLTKVIEAVRHGSMTVYEVAVALFGRLRGFHVMLGCAEANAHLELLEERGILRREEGRMWIV